MTARLNASAPAFDPTRSAAAGSAVTPVGGAAAASQPARSSFAPLTLGSGAQAPGPDILPPTASTVFASHGGQAPPAPNAKVGGKDLNSAGLTIGGSQHAVITPISITSAATQNSSRIPPPRECLQDSGTSFAQRMMQEAQEQHVTPLVLAQNMLRDLQREPVSNGGGNNHGGANGGAAAGAGGSGTSGTTDTGGLPLALNRSTVWKHDIDERIFASFTFLHEQNYLSMTNTTSMMEAAATVPGVPPVVSQFWTVFTLQTVRTAASVIAEGGANPNAGGRQAQQAGVSSLTVTAGGAPGAGGTSLPPGYSGPTDRPTVGRQSSVQVSKSAEAVSVTTVQPDRTLISKQTRLLLHSALLSSETLRDGLMQACNPFVAMEITTTELREAIQFCTSVLFYITRVFFMEADMIPVASQHKGRSGSSGGGAHTGSESGHGDGTPDHHAAGGSHGGPEDDPAMLANSSPTYSIDDVERFVALREAVLHMPECRSFLKCALPLMVLSQLHVASLQSVYDALTGAGGPRMMALANTVRAKLAFCQKFPEILVTFLSVAPRLGIFDSKEQLGSIFAHDNIAMAMLGYEMVRGVKHLEANHVFQAANYTGKLGGGGRTSHSIFRLLLARSNAAATMLSVSGNTMMHAFSPMTYLKGSVPTDPGKHRPPTGTIAGGATNAGLPPQLHSSASGDETVFAAAAAVVEAATPPAAPVGGARVAAVSPPMTADSPTRGGAPGPGGILVPQTTVRVGVAATAATPGLPRVSSNSDTASASVGLAGVVPAGTQPKPSVVVNPGLCAAADEQAASFGREIIFYSAVAAIGHMDTISSTTAKKVLSALELALDGDVADVDKLLAQPLIAPLRELLEIASRCVDLHDKGQRKLIRKTIESLSQRDPAVLGLHAQRPPTAAFVAVGAGVSSTHTTSSISADPWAAIGTSSAGSASW